MSDVIANVTLPEVPFNTDEARRDFDTGIRNAVLKLQAAMIPPATPTNFRATALAGAIQVDFTRSDGDGYTLLWNDTPSVNLAVHIDLGTANKYVDDIGAGSVKRYYIVQARKGNVLGAYSAWVSATTLALNVAITPPDPPPSTDTPVIDTETDAIDAVFADKGSYLPI